jgi:hypothetical protein
MKIRGMIFWVVAPCTLVGGYKHLAATFSVHLQGRTKGEGNMYHTVLLVTTTELHNTMTWKYSLLKLACMLLCVCFPQF